ncbi:hypothetical protein EMCRGX_G011813 [Ephydatia muelleri]
MAAACIRKFRVALIQLAVGKDKASNLQRAGQLIREAAGKGANIIALPECFNCPYGNKYFPEYAESIPGASTNLLSSIAKDCSIYLIGGSIPERDGDKLYNTCTVFGPTGTLLTKFRKMHLFDIDVPGKITFRESDILSPGDQFATFDTEWCKVGVAICYDLRFKDLASIYAQQGCQLLCYPGAFNMTTGPAHWELLIRSRALDNQLYVAAISPARDEAASYVAWGHSTLANPWGEVVAKASEKEDIVYGDVDLELLENVRKQIPVTHQRRLDLYTLSSQIPH